MKRFLLLTTAVVALASSGCSMGNPCRQTLINWNWFNRGDSCGSSCGGGYTACGGHASTGCDSCGGGQGPAPCSTTVPYASGSTIRMGGDQWVAPRGANYGEAELVPPGPMNIVPRG